MGIDNEPDFIACLELIKPETRRRIVFFFIYLFIYISILCTCGILMRVDIEIRSPLTRLSVSSTTATGLVEGSLHLVPAPKSEVISRSICPNQVQRLQQIICLLYHLSSSSYYCTWPQGRIRFEKNSSN